MSNDEHRYAKLKQLLDEQNKGARFTYTFKFICDVSPDFPAELAVFERNFPELRFVSKRPSQHGKHIALTYSLEANTPDDVVRVLLAIEKIRGLRVIL